MMSETETRSEVETPLERWERLCSRLEHLIGEWLEQTEVPGDLMGLGPAEISKVEKEWCQQLAAISMAAQRTAGLRAMLIEQTEAEGRDTEGGEGDAKSASEESRHWRQVESESEGDSDEG
ncbi:hypothetical protein JXA47_01980 [Candidatus Sumerlaeota bacterium]|nr:hypothetical protein [Candidatus Sumerlaeota bacterium]